MPPFSPWLSLVKADDAFEEDQLKALIVDGELVAFGRYYRDRTSGDEELPSRTPIGAVFALNSDFDIENNILCSNVCTEGNPPDMSCFVDVAFRMSDIEKFLGRKRRAGRPDEHNWPHIAEIVRRDAPQWTGSQNKFFQKIRKELRDAGQAPDLSTLKKRLGLLFNLSKP